MFYQKMLSMESYSKKFHNEDISSNTYLITGGAGFIGSNIVKYLIKYQAKKIIVLDNLSNGSYQNMEEFNTLHNFEFVKGYHTLFVVPFVELEYEYNGLKDYVRVNSSPRSSRLVYISYDRNLKQKVIRFARLKINLKNNNFRDDMLNACRAKILEFIKEHPDCKLDTKHLEPKLKNLLLFT